METVRVLQIGGDAGLGDALTRADDRLAVRREPAAAEGLDRFEAQAFDCLVVADDLPDGSGTEVVEAVRERDERTPVLLVGGSGATAPPAGATDYIRWTDADESAALPARRILNYATAARDRARLDRHETLFEALGDPVYGLDDEGRFTFVNDAFLDLVGYDESTVIGATPDLIKSPSVVETAERQLGQLLSADGPDSGTFEIEVTSSDGDPIRCEDHMGVLYERGEFSGSVGVLRDITERVERERAIRAERRLLERSLDALDDIYYLIDPDGTIQRSNASLSAVTGYDDPEGMDALELFEGEDREAIADAVAKVIESGSAKVEADLSTGAGRQIPYEFTGTRLTDEDGELRGIIGVGRDVTERVARERTLERKNARLEEFASVVSHDLRNPLNVAQGRIGLVEDGSGGDHVAVIERSLERMDALIDDLLVLAREGESLADAEPVDLRRIVESTRDTVENAGGRLDVRTDAAVVADESRLGQLVENLVRNAVEHGSTSSQLRTDDGVTVTVGELSDGSGFYVADDGPGISPDEREQVFENGYSSTRDGTGFGLSIVETVATGHEWDVRLVESDEGGARFEFRGVEFGP